MVATGLFVVGVAIERSEDDDHHGALVQASEGHAENGEESPHEESGEEGEAAHSEAEERGTEESHEELRPLGIDVARAHYGT